MESKWPSAGKSIPTLSKRLFRRRVICMCTTCVGDITWWPLILGIGLASLRVLHNVEINDFFYL